MDWRERVDRELAAAEAARARGNEGMARVCARRAAGWTVKAYLEQERIKLSSPLVLDYFDYILQFESLQPEVRSIIEHMQQAKIQGETTGESYWPLDIDLIAEAKRLRSLLSR